jgi:cytochrome c biogenesis protein CcdA
MYRRFSPKTLAPALALGLLLGLGEAASACPSCQAALAAHDPESANLVRGYFYSILFMIGMPFTMLSIFSFSMYRAVKQAERERNLAEGEPAPLSNEIDAAVPELCGAAAPASSAF